MTSTNQRVRTPWPGTCNAGSCSMATFESSETTSLSGASEAVPEGKANHANGLRGMLAAPQKLNGLAAAPALAVNWFAAYTNSHHEKRVASILAGRQIESFLPLYAA